MAEEFSESEVVFSDYHHHQPPSADKGLDERLEVAVLKQRKNSQAMRCGAGSGPAMETKTVASSLPVNIPESMMLRQWEETEDEEEMVPPHVIVGRRFTGKMAFSVCTGNGRTLKGRDLSQVRNAILRLTGFLEV